MHHNNAGDRHEQQAIERTANDFYPLAHTVKERAEGEGEQTQGKIQATGSPR